MYRSLSKQYFTYFSDQNLSGLADMFAENITLRDWNIDVHGLKAVLEANRQIFNSVKSIRIEPINFYNDGRVMIAEINILIDECENLRVVDVIEFNEHDKIVAIRAYKG